MKKFLLFTFISIACCLAWKISAFPGLKHATLSERLVGDETTVKAIDGTIYHTIKIGTQVWMQENLKVTQYNDGSEIPNVKNDSAWMQLETGACCDYDNNSGNGAKYGKLYNWYAVHSGRLCPPGWHIPTLREWQTLVNYTGGDSLAGFALQAQGKGTWVDATTFEPIKINSSKFTALAGGKRQQTFAFLEGDVFFWSADEFCLSKTWCEMAHYVTMYADSRHVHLDEVGNKFIGMSVRCVKDAEQ